MTELGRVPPRDVFAGLRQSSVQTLADFSSVLEVLTSRSQWSLYSGEIQNRIVSQLLAEVLRVGAVTINATYQASSEDYLRFLDSEFLIRCRSTDSHDALKIRALTSIERGGRKRGAYLHLNREPVLFIVADIGLIYWDEVCAVKYPGVVTATAAEMPFSSMEDHVYDPDHASCFISLPLPSIEQKKSTDAIRALLVDVAQEASVATLFA